MGILGSEIVQQSSPAFAQIKHVLPAEHGLTALLRKPLQRERPNERFLQGTLRSVAFGEEPPSLLLWALHACEVA